MLTFSICFVVLVAAYFLYGRFLEYVVGVDEKADMPSKTHYDGVDFMPLPRWRIFLIQLLNIAGTGPIFGAVLGACYGPVAFLWITIGGIFMGAMHDFVSGVISIRNNGQSLPEIIGKYLGGGMHKFTLVVIPILMILVGAVFIVTPSQILSDKTDTPYLVWVAIIIVYYFVATILPVDKIIGKIYPIFGASLIFMAVALFGVLLFGGYSVPELTSVENMHFNAEKLPIIPTLFISIACGAISGFHATQSPLMARCMNNEGEARMIFYGSMITESIIALFWGSIGMAFFHGPDSLAAALVEHGNNAAWAVSTIANTTLGAVGGFVALFGVVAAAITSGDTAFRSARLIISDILHFEQRTLWKRFVIALPLFAIGMVLLFVDFDVVWRYFAWTNQTMSVVTLWVIVVYLKKYKRNIWVALPPAVFMTYICTSFVFVSNQFVGMQNRPLAYALAGVVTLAITAAMWLKVQRSVKNV